MRKKYITIIVLLFSFLFAPSDIYLYGQRNTEKCEVSPSPSQDIISEHEYVDLGLSVLWATCNVGASSPEEYGIFFPWGEVDHVESFSWESYKYGEISNDKKHLLNKYVPTDADDYGIEGYSDGLTCLDKIDDVANSQWNSNWRIPTRDEFRELCSNCTLKWITINGHNGYQFTADNGNSIFLPAAGHREGDLYYWDENRYGYYWSADVFERKPKDAWGLYFHRGIADVAHGARNRGFSIRPVVDR